MQVRVRLRREAGAFRPPYGQGHTAMGDLHLTHRTADGRKIPLLHLLGADRQWPNLYEPRIISLSARQLCFLGFERNGDACAMQQWDASCFNSTHPFGRGSTVVCRRQRCCNGPP